MLKPAWYLTDGDYFGELPAAPQLDTIESALRAVTQLFNDEGEVSPTQTTAATYMAVLAAEHIKRRHHPQRSPPQPH